MILVESIAAVVLVLLVIAGGLYALERTNERPAIGALVLFVWLATLVFFMERRELLQRNIGGVNLVGADVICAFLSGIAALRFFKRLPRIGAPFVIPLVLIGGTLLLSYVRGVWTFGPQRSTNEFREFFYFLAALAFTISFPAGKLAEKVPVVSIIGGALLTVVALVRIPMMGGFSLEQRSVPSYVALAMGQAFFFGWAWTSAHNKSKIWRWAVFSFLLLAFVMLHRSVWIALTLGFATLLYFERSGRKGLITAVVVAGLTGTLVGGALFGEKISAGLNQAVTEATSSEESTFVWRLKGWGALLRPPTGWNFTDLAIGNPMGSGYARTLNESVFQHADIESGVIPHNYYISMILRGGIIGLLAFLALYVALVKGFLRERRNAFIHPYTTCFLAIFATQLCYYIPYSADMIQGIFLGGGIALGSAFYFAPVNQPQLA